MAGRSCWPPTAGRVARAGAAAYALTKHGMGALSEALRQEVTGRYVRVSVVEPGATDTELSGHNRPEVLAGMRQQVSGMQPMAPEDVADAVGWIVTRSRQVAVNEILVRSTEQAY